MKYALKALTHLSIALIFMALQCVPLFGDSHSGTEGRNATESSVTQNAPKAPAREKSDESSTPLFQRFAPQLPKNGDKPAGRIDFEEVARLLNTMNEGGNIEDPAKQKALYDYLSLIPDDKGKILLGMMSEEEKAKSPGLVKALQSRSDLSGKSDADLKAIAEGSDPVVAGIAKTEIRVRKDNAALSLAGKTAVRDHRIIRELNSRGIQIPTEVLTKHRDKLYQGIFNIDKRLAQGDLPPETEASLRWVKKEYEDQARSVGKIMAQRTKDELQGSVWTQSETWKNAAIGYGQFLTSKDGVHTMLGAAGQIPIAGMIFDGADFALYTAEGDKAGAAMAGVAFIPLVGDAAAGVTRAGKAIGKAAHATDGIATATREVRQVARTSEAVVESASSGLRTAETIAESSSSTANAIKVRPKWDVSGADKIGRGPKGKLYHDPKSDLWWSKDLDNHGGSQWKVFKKEKNQFSFIAEADDYGDFIDGKHKSPVGMSISLKDIVWSSQ